MPWQHPTGTAPESVAILGLGPSKSDFFDCQIPHNFTPPWQEVWGINVGIRYQHDLLFCMDNLEKELSRYTSDQYPDQLRASAKPIITSETHPDVPASYEYPLLEVLSFWKTWQCLPRSSLPSVLAYAGFIGVKRLFLFGVDYSWNDGRREAGALWTAFWLGRLAEHGVQINITESSSMMDASARMTDPDYVQFYGYSVPPPIHRMYKAKPEQRPE